MRSIIPMIALLLLGACSSSSSTSSTGSTTASSTTGAAGVLAAGALCGANGACASGICDITGKGRCCAAACSTTGTCGANACDDTGACSYPIAGLACGSSSCSDGMTTLSSCDGHGDCAPGTPSPCANHYGCQGVAGICATSCTSSAECASGFSCNAGVCGAKIALGPCTENDDCQSGACGTTGTGHCCNKACTSTSASCAGADCDATTGACDYPVAACGTQTQSCSGDSQQDASHCDGQGNCFTPNPISCGSFGCAQGACLTSCSDNAGCATGDFCDVSASRCCGGFAGDAGMAVDAVTGSDSTTCCGIGLSGACATLTHAMKLIDASQTTGVKIVATVNGGGGDWPLMNGEAYPVALGWGVELSAPGVFFYAPDFGAELFDIGPVSANDTVGSASIFGDSDNPIWIGMDAEGDQSSDPAIVQIEGGGKLWLANASVNGSASAQNNAIFVAAGASLIIGKDQLGLRSGPVVIGNDFTDQSADGWNGIVCGSDQSTGCSISDVNLGGSNLTISNQEGVDIDAEDNASIRLSQAPVFGVAPTATGFRKCGSKSDSSGTGGPAILLNGAVVMSVLNGTVQCIAGDGFMLQASPNGTPKLTLTGMTIQNTELGVYASAGTAKIATSTIWYNYNGVEQDTDGTNNGAIDLSGGAGGGTNVVVCSNGGESAYGKGGLTENPGTSVLNTTTAVLNASNVTWDTSGPDQFMCDPTLTDCTCELSSCSVAASAQGMDAVYEVTGGTITTTGSALSQADCSLSGPATGCGPGSPCPPNQTCCPPIAGGTMSTCEVGIHCPG